MSSHFFCTHQLHTVPVWDRVLIRVLQYDSHNVNCKEDGTADVTSDLPATVKTTVAMVVSDTLSSSIPSRTPQRPRERGRRFPSASTGATACPSERGEPKTVVDGEEALSPVWTWSSDAPPSARGSRRRRRRAPTAEEVRWPWRLLLTFCIFDQ